NVMGPAMSTPLITPALSLMEQVYERLIAEIADGRLEPMQKISQEEIAHRFNVSRQPVSHAIQLLKKQRLVQDAGKKGIEIAPIDVDHIRRLYQARMALEYLAVGLAAGRVARCEASENEINSARQALRQGQAILDNGE